MTYITYKYARTIAYTYNDSLFIQRIDYRIPIFFAARKSRTLVQFFVILHSLLFCKSTMRPGN